MLIDSNHVVPSIRIPLRHDVLQEGAIVHFQNRSLGETLSITMDFKCGSTWCFQRPWSSVQDFLFAFAQVKYWHHISERRGDFWMLNSPFSTDSVLNFASTFLARSRVPTTLDFRFPLGSFTITLYCLLVVVNFRLHLWHSFVPSFEADLHAVQ